MIDNHCRSLGLPLAVHIDMLAAGSVWVACLLNTRSSSSLCLCQCLSTMSVALPSLALPALPVSLCPLRVSLKISLPFVLPKASIFHPVAPVLQERQVASQVLKTPQQVVNSRS